MAGLEPLIICYNIIVLTCIIKPQPSVRNKPQQLSRSPLSPQNVSSCFHFFRLSSKIRREFRIKITSQGMESPNKPRGVFFSSKPQRPRASLGPLEVADHEGEGRRKAPGLPSPTGNPWDERYIFTYVAWLIFMV